MKASGNNSQGHPQHLKNTTTTPFPPPYGILNSLQSGALPPIAGAGATSIGAGGGVVHGAKAFGTVILANGFVVVQSPVACSSPIPFPFEFVEVVVELEGNVGAEKFKLPRPALWRAILVESFPNMVGLLMYQLK